MSINNIGILGGGFGLYGYMPAAIQSNYTTLVLSKYKEIIAVHPILKIYLRTEYRFQEDTKNDIT